MIAQIWTIPAERMKTGREHRVPHSEGTMAVLREVLLLRDRGWFSQPRSEAARYQT